MSRFGYVGDLIHRIQKEAALNRLISQMFVWEPHRNTWRFFGGSDIDGATRITDELMEDFKRQALTEGDTQ